MIVIQCLLQFLVTIQTIWNIIISPFTDWTREQSHSQKFSSSAKTTLKYFIDFFRINKIWEWANTRCLISFDGDLKYFQ